MSYDGTKLFEWKNKEQCLAELMQYSSDILNDELKNEILASNPEGCWEDDLTWALTEDVGSIVANRFTSYYSHILAYHACRPDSFLPYAQNGLKAHNLNVLESRFHEIYSDVSPSILDKAIDLSKQFMDETGKIFFVSDDEELIRTSGHYLIQGSEHLLGLAARLNELIETGNDFRTRLREIGVPTIIEVNIPLKRVPEPQILATAKQLVALWGNSFCFPDEQHNPSSGYVIYGDLPPEYIKHHYHPTKIHDPHGLVHYYSKTKVCDGCSLALQSQLKD